MINVKLAKGISKKFKQISLNLKFQILLFQDYITATCNFNMMYVKLNKLPLRFGIDLDRHYLQILNMWKQLVTINYMCHYWHIYISMIWNLTNFFIYVKLIFSSFSLISYPLWSLMQTYVLFNLRMIREWNIMVCDGISS